MEVFGVSVTPRAHCNYMLTLGVLAVHMFLRSEDLMHAFYAENSGGCLVLRIVFVADGFGKHKTRMNTTFCSNQNSCSPDDKKTAVWQHIRASSTYNHGYARASCFFSSYLFVQNP